MKNLRQYLFAGEDLALVVRPHPIVLAKPFLVPLAGVVLMTALPNEITLLVFTATLLRFGWDVAQWWMHQYMLTTDRIVNTEGIISKKIMAMPLAKITDLMYTRSLTGRLLGYGVLHFESAGQKGLERIDFVPDPDYFYRAVMSLALGPKRPSTSAHKVIDALSHAGRPLASGELPPIRRHKD
jgi:hypothetical protein